MISLRVPYVVLPNGWPAFRGAVVAGAAAGVALASALALRRGVPFGVWLFTAAAAALSAYLYAAVTRLVTGAEWTASFRLMACVLGGAWVALRLRGVAPLAYLDLLALALCVNQALGRLGCLLAGCCHGRPARAGLVYSDAHAGAGLPRHLVGVVLAPTQLVEAAALGLLGAALAVIMLRPHAAGDVLAVYVCGYALARVGLDFFRGDSPRPYAFGLAQAQLATLGFVALVARLSATGGLPARAAYQLAPLLVSALALGLLAWRRFDRSGRHRLLAPPHVAELATALHALDGVPRVVCTSQGVRVSGSSADARNARRAHVTFSRKAPPLGVAEARVLAELVGQLLRWPAAAELVSGAPGIFHVVRTPPQAVARVQEASA